MQVIFHVLGSNPEVVSTSDGRNDNGHVKEIIGLFDSILMLVTDRYIRIRGRLAIFSHNDVEYLAWRS